MADADSTTHIACRLDVIDTLDHAVAVAQFVQGITLSPGAGGGLHLHAGQLSGLYCVMQDLIDRITSACAIVGEHEFATKDVHQKEASHA